MSDDSDDDEIKSKLDIRTSLLLGVPVLAIAGCVYFVGFFSTAGMPYFTLLELQDFVVAAAKTLPPVLAYIVLLFLIGGADSDSKIQKHYDDLVEGKEPEEALALLRDENNRYFKKGEFKEGEIDFVSLLFKDKDGEWSREKILNWKGFNYIWTTVWFLVAGLCIYGVQVPVFGLVIIGILFTGTFSVVIQYYWFRFDVDFNIFQLWAIQIMTVVFIWGVWDARAEQSSVTPRYEISAEGRTTTTSSFRRVGSSVLFFDQTDGAWRITQRDGALITKRPQRKRDSRD